MIPTGLFVEVNNEHESAIAKFLPFHSAHEGLAIIQEEYEELKTEVFRNQSRRDMTSMRKEALQLATMALRFIMDICDKEDK